MAEAGPEPWLRGPLESVHPLVQPVFFSFAQVREDLARHVAGMSREEVWRTPGTSSVGFHLKHLAGSVERLTTYLMEGELTEAQLDSLRRENQGEENASELLALVDQALSASEQRMRQLNSSNLYEPRAVGRKHLPTTVIGLLVHLSEHTQRHLGQAITTAKVVRNTG